MNLFERFTFNRNFKAAIQEMSDGEKIQHLEDYSPFLYEAINDPPRYRTQLEDFSEAYLDAARHGRVQLIQPQADFRNLLFAVGMATNPAVMGVEIKNDSVRVWDHGKQDVDLDSDQERALRLEDFYHSDGSNGLYNAYQLSSHTHPTTALLQGMEAGKLTQALGQGFSYEPDLSGEYLYRPTRDYQGTPIGGKPTVITESLLPEDLEGLEITPSHTL